MESTGTGRKTDIMMAWSGAAFDTKRNRLLVHGGGGQGQQDNGIFAFSLETLSWSRVTPANPYWRFPAERSQDTNPDGTPASVHSYGGLVYIPEPRDWFVRIGGARWHDDYSMSRIFAYAFRSGTWSQVGDAGSSWLGFAAAYDAARERVVFWDYLRVRAWRPGRNSASVMSQESPIAISDGMNAVVDPDRRVLWLIGVGSVVSMPLDGSWPLPLRFHKTHGEQAPVKSYAPGLAYDPHLKKIVAWTGWSRVFTLDPVSRAWTSHASSTAQYPKNPTAHGVWGRFQYAPKHNLYVGVDSVDRNVWLYRLAPDTVTPSPSASPPSASLPANTWVRRTLPSYDPAVYTASLPVSPVGGIKHVRVRYNPSDKKLYVFGGDHSGGMDTPWDTARHEVYTYDVATDQWAKVHPRCLDSGRQPLSPDQVLVDYDSRRNVFWVLSDEVAPSVKCSTGVRQTSDKVFAFDPLTHRFTETSRRSLSSIYPDWRGSIKNWLYDHKTDKIYAFGGDSVFRYTIQSPATGRDWWEQLPIGDYRERTKRLGHSYVARGGRWLYTVDLYASRLYRWHIDRHRLEDLGPMPVSTGRVEEEAHGLIAWNETAGRLMFVRARRLWAYDPEAKTWAEIAGNSDRIAPLGNALAWDAAHNALVVFGGIEPSNPHLYLFRYVRE